MESRRRSDSNEIPMVDSQDHDEEQENFLAIDAEDEEHEELDEFNADAESSIEPTKHWMRFLNTQSNNGAMGGMKIQRTVARFMSDVFRATYSATTNSKVQHGRTTNNNSDETEID